MLRIYRIDIVHCLWSFVPSLSSVETRGTNDKGQMTFDLKQINATGWLGTYLRPDYIQSSSGLKPFDLIMIVRMIDFEIFYASIFMMENNCQ